jgi:hypothetical protein
MLDLAPSAKSNDSPTGRLLAGLAATPAAVRVFSFYALRQIRGLEDLPANTETAFVNPSLYLGGS